MKGFAPRTCGATSRTSCSGRWQKLEEDLFKHKLKKITNQLENTMVIRQHAAGHRPGHTVLAARLRETGSAAAHRRQRCRRQRRRRGNP